MYNRFLDIHVIGANGEYSHPFDIQAMGEYVLSKMRADQTLGKKSPAAVYFINQDTTDPDRATLSNIDTTRLPAVGYVAVGVPLQDIKGATNLVTYRALMAWVGDKWYRGKLRVNCHGASDAVGTMIVGQQYTHIGSIGRWIVANKLPSVNLRELWRKTGGACGLATVTLAICYAAREDTKTGGEAVLSGVAAVASELRKAEYSGIVVTGASLPVRIYTPDSQLLSMTQRHVDAQWTSEYLPKLQSLQSSGLCDLINDILDTLPPQTAQNLCSDKSALDTMLPPALLVLYKQALVHQMAQQLMARRPSGGKAGQLLIKSSNTLARFAHNDGKVSEVS